MRGLLDRLYDFAAALAAVMLVGVLVMVLLGITGRLLRFYVPGTDAYAGYLMAGAGFLALAHTLRRGEHIRVTLLLGKDASPRNRALQVWSRAAGVLLCGLLAWFSVRFAWQSHVFHDISTGNDATPLWIPQLSMAIGSVILLIAMVDELVTELRHGPRDRLSAEPIRSE
jgi:TRAP-type C4-dicarboxylate transport system permease small subunit